LINVSWEQAKAYVAWLSRMTGKPYRLLTEAEWEYAARGVISADAPHPPYPWGDEASHEYANYGTDQYCGGRTAGRDKWFYTAPVGEFPPNAFGLCDMHGNVWEWVEDIWHDSYGGAPANGSAWTEGEDASRRVVRGGSWGNTPQDLRSAARYGNPSDLRYYNTNSRHGWCRRSKNFREAVNSRSATVGRKYAQRIAPPISNTLAELALGRNVARPILAMERGIRPTRTVSRAGERA
jgi:formylglycine-generating enzyme required for sulfatase activity